MREVEPSLGCLYFEVDLQTVESSWISLELDCTMTLSDPKRSPMMRDTFRSLKEIGDVVREVSDGGGRGRAGVGAHDMIGSGARPTYRRSRSLGPGVTRTRSIIDVETDEDGESIEEVIEDDDTEVEVEYYDSEGEIEEIVLDDEAFDEIEVEEKEFVPVSPEKDARSLPKLADNVELSPEQDTIKTDDDDEPEDLPDKDDVLEAIGYIMRQEKVHEYGLVTEAQAEEMTRLPLPELMLIMNHFEQCDNYDATIRWDLVLTMINPAYGNQDVDSDEEEAADKAADLPPSRRGSHKPESDSDVSSGDDAFSLPSDTAAQNNEHASVGSGYSLEVDHNSVHSGMTGHESEYFFDTEVVIDNVPESAPVQVSATSNMDPRIRATYTKTMVELERNRSFDR